MTKSTGWISVDDRLPDSVNEDVWVYGKNGVTIGSYWRVKLSGDIYWSDVYGNNDGLRDSSLYGVTHWMPMDIPEPPKAPPTSDHT